MSILKIENGVIKSTSIGYSERGGFCCTLTIKYAHSAQCMQIPFIYDSKKLFHDFVGFTVSRILEVVGVERWDELIGKSVRIKSDEYIREIGNFLVDDWFNPEKELKERVEKRKAIYEN